MSRASGANDPGAGIPRHNVPARLTSFVGRERELAAVADLVRALRLVTLVGAPGVGKTRLALQSALGLLEAFPDGVWLVELAPLADPDLVPHAVADVLGVREQPGRTLTVALADYLRTRRLLLVLDNCEHLIIAAATMAETLLQGCPNLHVLATSREPLAIEGEATHRVPSLSVPDLRGERVASSSATTTVALASFEAVQLFVERARTASPTFTLTERNATLIGQICARLDGIPLAIELAAARVRALSVEQIAARLDDRFQLLTGGFRTALRRQQTLRGAVEWSYDLLPEPEQALLRRLAVFAGGFSLEAVDAVANEQPNASTFDLLISLVDKSLVQINVGDDGQRRYRLLETFREYGRAKLIEHGELSAVRDRHRDYFLALAEEIAPAIKEREDSTLVARLEREHDNFRVALNWCLDAPDTGRDVPTAAEREQEESGTAIAVRLAAALWRFWLRRGYMSDGRRLVARVITKAPSDSGQSDQIVRAFAPLGLINLSAYQGGTRIAVTLMTAQLARCRETGDNRGVVTAMHRLGFYLAHLGEFERGAQLCAESVALGRQLGHPFTLADALHASLTVALIRQQYEQCIALCEEAISLFRPLGTLTLLASALRTQSLCNLELGNLGNGLKLAEDAFRVGQKVGAKRGLCMSYKDLGRFAMLTGDITRANELLYNAVALVQQTEDRWIGIVCISVLASVKVAEGTQPPTNEIIGSALTDEARQHLVAAAQLFAAADLLREQDGMALPADIASTYHRDLAVLGERLGKDRFTQACADGRAMSYEQAIEYALAITAAAAPPTPEVTTTAGSRGAAREDDAASVQLSPREWEVAMLVAQGRTNREVAELLVLSERTVDSHIRNIMSKLKVRSRAQIAAWTARQRREDPR